MKGLAGYSGHLPQLLTLEAVNSQIITEVLSIAKKTLDRVHFFLEH
jgi:hypothetical protein